MLAGNLTNFEIYDFHIFEQNVRNFRIIEKSFRNTLGILEEISPSSVKLVIKTYFTQFKKRRKGTCLKLKFLI